VVQYPKFPSSNSDIDILATVTTYKATSGASIADTISDLRVRIWRSILRLPSFHYLKVACNYGRKHLKCCGCSYCHNPHFPALQISRWNSHIVSLSFKNYEISASDAWIQYRTQRMISALSTYIISSGVVTAFVFTLCIQPVLPLTHP